MTKPTALPSSIRDQTRSGERVFPLPARPGANVVFIGHIETPFTTRDACPRQGSHDGPICRILLDPPYDEALKGLEDFDTIEVLYWMHEARRDLLQQNPRHDGATLGTFALRSPLRPNPIATSRVHLIGIEGNIVNVRGLDCLNGTPLVDLKPDRCKYTPLALPK
ncbi:MAG: tRNA (N6-threonylcarbamoyladenosine(37)-N6)-methyltransferase TrmO [Hyphomicrobiaceae bacterium]